MSSIPQQLHFNPWPGGDPPSWPFAPIPITDFVVDKVQQRRLFEMQLHYQEAVQQAVLQAHQVILDAAKEFHTQALKIITAPQAK